MNDQTRIFWMLLDVDALRLSADQLRAWPADVVTWLTDRGWLLLAEQARLIPCPDCGEEHYEEPIVLTGPDGNSRIFIPCSAHGRVELEPEDLQRWTIRIEPVIGAVTQQLALTGRITPVISGRLWRLGRAKWGSSTRDVFFARRLDDTDAAAVINQIERVSEAIVLVPDRTPSDSVWSRGAPAVVPLSQVSHCGLSGLDIDLDAVFSWVRASDESRTAIEQVIDRRHLKLVVRQQVKAEEKSSLTDDVLVAAYRQAGSVRKAADFLSEQTGSRISKDKVQRALQRAGGQSAVASGQDSESVRRTVASQRRDSRKKIPNRPEAMDFQ